MRVYTRVVCQWQPDGSLKRIEADAFEYEGPVALCKDSPSPPPAPNYVGAAQATADSSHVNQNTPYGSQTYTLGSSYIDPITNLQRTNPATSTISLNPQAQHALDSQMGMSAGFGDLGLQQMPAVSQGLSNPMDLSSVPQIADQAYAMQTARLDPQWQQATGMKQTELANQGLVPGGEAYDNAMRVFNQGKTDAYQQARLGAIQTMPQSYQLANATYNQPLNTLNAIRTGAQVQNPTFSPAGAGANYLGAAQSQGQYAQGLYGANVAETNASNQQSATMAAAAIAAMISDRRLKINIVKIGEHPRGFGIYEYDLFGQHQCGVMADEVERIIPEAVITLPNGYKAVYYQML